MIINDKQRDMFHQEKPSIEILCYEKTTTLIVGNECYMHVTGLKFKAGNETGRELMLTLDIDGFANEFVRREKELAPTKAEAVRRTRASSKKLRLSKFCPVRLIRRVPILRKHA